MVADRARSDRCCTRRNCDYLYQKMPARHVLLGKKIHSVREVPPEHVPIYSRPYLSSTVEKSLLLRDPFEDRFSTMRKALSEA